MLKSFKSKRYQTDSVCIFFFSSIKNISSSIIFGWTEKYDIIFISIIVLFI